MAMDPLLSVQDLSVVFHTDKGPLPVLDAVSFDVGVGETVCLVGESGSGKSATVKSIMQLIGYENGEIVNGSVLFDGQDLVTFTPMEMRSIRGKRMAMIFQEPMCAFDPVFTIGSQIVESIVYHDGVSRQDARARAVALLGRVGISEPKLRMKQYPSELSGGMLQRAMIAMALSCNPELLIADEPTTALDVTTQAQILHLLNELQDEYRMSVILITHDLGVAAAFADRIIVMYTSRIVEQAAVGSIFQNPQHPYTQGLLQSVTASLCEKGQKLPSIAGSIPTLHELPEGCYFHPRCPYAQDRCKVASPPLEGKTREHQVACWYRGVRAQGDLPAAEAISITEQGEHSTSLEERVLFDVDNVRKYYPNGKGFSRKKRFPIRAVDGVSFKIVQGETFGLVGESGSGKSTLGRLLLGLEDVTGGEVVFDGQDLSQLSTRSMRHARRNMQTIFQDPYGSMDPRWRVRQIIEEPLSAHGHLNSVEKREHVEELLEMVGLDKRLYNRFPHQFSGGQRQRIAIARAIALQPKFILADEAVSALDVSVQAQIVNLMQELQQQMGLTYLFIAHGLDTMRHLADRLGVMYLGKMVEIAPSEELFCHPAHHYTHGLIASIPKADPKKKVNFASIEGEIPSPAKPPSGCRFHPRCPAATSRCAEEEPCLAEVSANHYLACHNPR